MDEKNREIVQSLQEDARKPYTQIARETNLSETAVRNRISKLEDRGIIKGYSVDIEPRAMGYDVVSITGINTKPECFLEVARKVNELERTRDVRITSGDHTVMATIWAKSGEELSRMISKEIGSIEGVEKVFPAIVLENLEKS